METGCRRAPRVTAHHDPHPGTPGNRRSGGDRHGDGLVRGAQAVRMVDAHHASAGHRAGEHDGSRPRRPYRGAGPGGQVDAAVAGQPGLGRRVEAPYHRGRPVERPPEATDRHRRPRRRPGQRRSRPHRNEGSGSRHDNRKNEAENTHAPEPRPRPPHPATTNRSPVDSQIDLWTTPIHSPGCATPRTRCPAARSPASQAPPR
jgi:hypothetical protein